MARRKKPEEHMRHEAWAIPYGDLVTLLLAFFVTMYAISSVNQGKYRVLSDSLVAAFRGAPQALEPVEVGERPVASDTDIHMTIVDQANRNGTPNGVFSAVPFHKPNAPEIDAAAAKMQAAAIERSQALARVAGQVENAMQDLIKSNLVAVRRHDQWVEVEIGTDLLFASGVATLAAPAVTALAKLADSLAPFPNSIRIEGHTDDRPISTAVYPSNWELSAARAASVARIFVNRGITPARLAVVGLAQFRPAASNETAEGRNANRRVLLVIQAATTAPEGDRPADGGPDKAAQAPAATAAQTGPVVPAVAGNARAMAIP
jgi:chemotaxis protein MotB